MKVTLICIARLDVGRYGIIGRNIRQPCHSSQLKGVYCLFRASEELLRGAVSDLAT